MKHWLGENNLESPIRNGGNLWSSISELRQQVKVLQGQKSSRDRIKHPGSETLQEAQSGNCVHQKSLDDVELREGKENQYEAGNVQGANQEVQRLKKLLVQVRKENCRLVSDLKAEHEVALNQMKTDYETKIAKLTEDYERRLKEKDDEFEAVVVEQNEKNIAMESRANEIEELKAYYEDQLNKGRQHNFFAINLVEEKNKEIADLKKEISAYAKGKESFLHQERNRLVLNDASNPKIKYLSLPPLFRLTLSRL